MLTVNKNKPKDENFWANMPLDDLAFGNAMDCDFTLRAFHVLRKEMEEKQVNFVYDNLLKDILVILGMVENFGISVDTQYLKVLDQKLQEEIAGLDDRLQELIDSKKGRDDRINPNSTIEMASILFTSEGFGLIPSMFSDKTKTPRISEEHLTEVMKTTKTKMRLNSFRHY